MLIAFLSSHAAQKKLTLTNPLKKNPRIIPFKQA